jgi:hypothetical protein
LETQGGSEHQGRTTGGAEGLKGDSRGEPDELDVFVRGEGRERLGVTIHDKGDLKLSRANEDETDLELIGFNGIEDELGWAEPAETKMTWD